jgi:micrococcal nuclease
MRIDKYQGFFGIVLSSILFPLFSVSCSLISLLFQNESALEDQKIVPTAKISKFASVEGMECIPDPAGYETAMLLDVIDGDSIEVAIEGEIYEVRYIGIDAPEFNSDQRAAAVDAAQMNERLLSGPIIYLFRDRSETDKYERLLRYVISNNTFINLEMVRSGHAISKTYHPDVSCQSVFDSVVQ